MSTVTINTGRKRPLRRSRCPARPCEACSKPFRPLRDDGKFCSDTCRVRANRRSYSTVKHQKAAPSTGFPRPLPDRTLHADWLTGCRYVALEGDLHFLKIDVQEYLGIQHIHTRTGWGYLPIEFIPGGASRAAARLVIIRAAELEQNFRTRRPALHDLADYWPSYIADLKRQHDLTTAHEGQRT